MISISSGEDCSMICISCVNKEIAKEVPSGTSFGLLMKAGYLCFYRTFAQGAYRIRNFGSSERVVR